MDRAELKKILEPFHAKCAEKGKPLLGICVEEAFPGDTSTSFIIQGESILGRWNVLFRCHRLSVRHTLGNYK